MLLSKSDREGKMLKQSESGALSDIATSYIR